MVFRRFYSEVGKLMFAFASIDGEVKRKEYEKIREIVKNKLVPHENSTDQFGTDAAYYAEIEFDILMDQMPSPKSCFNSFCNYVEAHRTAFDQHHQKMINDMVHEISRLYHGNHSKELEMIKSLRKKLSDIFSLQ